MLKMILVLDFNKSNRNVECGKSPCKGTIRNVKLYVDENDDDDNNGNGNIDENDDKQH